MDLSLDILNGKLIFSTPTAESGSPTLVFYAGGIVEGWHGDIPNGYKDGDTDVLSLILGTSVIRIGDEAFRNLTLGAVIQIPPNVTEVGERAFAGILASIDLSLANLVVIREQAFSSVSFTAGLSLLSVSELGEQAFSGANSNGPIQLSKFLVSVPNRAFQSYTVNSGSPGIQFAAGGVLETIGDYAFADMVLADTAPILLPDTLVSIGTGAFENSTIGGISIPNSVTEIGEMAFFGTYITNLVLSESLTVIRSASFSSLFTVLPSVAIPDSVTVIEDFAFSQTIINSLTLGEGVVSIGDRGFDNLAGGTLTFPDSLLTIGEYAFEAAAIIGELNTNNVNTIGDYAFADCSADQLTLGEGLVTIGTGSFLNLFNVTGDLILPQTLVTVGASAFADSPFDGKLVIPESVMLIGNGAFQGCSGLTSVECYVVKSVLNVTNSLSSSGVSTIRVRASDSTWTAGADTIGGKAVTVVKDL